MSCDIKVVGENGERAMTTVPRIPKVAFVFVLALAQPSIAQTMSLPGNFGVSASGAAAYTIPIVVPPGTSSMAPSLELAYSSEGANGLLGMGWSLGGLPTMGRCPQTFAQDGVRGAVKFDVNDRFCLDGQRLIAISGSYGADGTEYRTEIESFNRVISHGTAGNGPAWFEVRTKSGQVIEFGHSADALILAQGQTTARTWAVNKVSDTKGNYFTVGYTNDAVNGQAYPIEINYTGNTAAGLTPYNKVQFVYANRPDIISAYHAGSLSRTTMRLTNVKTYTSASLVADYKLAYQQSVATLSSRLISVTLCDVALSCLPAASYTWQDRVGGSFPSVFVPSYAQFAHSNGAAGSIAGDFNADGRADVLVWRDDPSLNRLLLSNGDGTFTQPAAFNPSFSQLGHSNRTMGVLLGDFNADGKTDILRWYDDPTYNAVFLSNGDGTFVQASSPTYAQFGHSNGAAGSLVGDFNGDGRPDVLLWRDDPSLNRLLLSNGDGTFTQPAAFNPSFSQLGHSNRTMGILLGDFNADGKTDILRWYDDPTYNAVFLSNGDGTFVQASSPTYAQFGHSNGAAGSLVGDFNGDGRPDVLLWRDDPSLNRLLLSNGDGTFTQPAAFNPSFSQLGHSNRTMGILLGDFNADGKTDILRWYDDPTYNAVFLSNGDGTFVQASSPTYAQFGHSNSTAGSFAADFNGDGRSDVLAWRDDPSLNRLLQPEYGIADLLVSATTSIGATTSITYQPLTNASVYSKDNTATYPVQDMQVPIYVVSRVDASNGVGGVYSGSYTYAGAKADVSGRGFLGFRQMKVTDLQTGIVETANYLQNFPYVGVLASKTKTLSTQTLAQTTSTYQFSNVSNAAAVSAPSGTGAPYRVSIAQSVSGGSDLDGTALPSTTSTFQYDAFGNATQVAVANSDGHSKTTTNTYTNNATNWLLGRLTASSVTGQAP
jgi:hypothetical protein